MSADALAGWLAAEPSGGVTPNTRYVELHSDELDMAMPPLEADTAFQPPPTARHTAVTATLTATPTSSLSMPLPVNANSSIVIQQTTHIEKTVRTEVRGANGISHSISSSIPRLFSSPQLSHSAAAVPPPVSPSTGRASSSSSTAALSSTAMTSPMPDLIPPPTRTPSLAASTAPSPASSLAVSEPSLSSPSAASTSLLSADSDPTDEFLENEGLHPRFCPWTAVSSPLPSQSFSSYLDTCERTMPAEALAALQKCPPGDPTAENMHADPFPLLREPAHSTQPAFTVLQRADSEHGLMQYKLVASRPIKEKEVIGFIAGHLESEHEAEREGVDRTHPSHIHINRGYLHRYLEYSHSEALVLSLKRFHSPLHHIRDPALFLSDFDEKRPEVSAYNVHVDLLLDPVRRVPVVIAFAWVDIEPGQELTAYLGLGDWYSRDHQRLFLASRVSHWYHRKVTDMEKTLDAHNIDFQKQLAKETPNGKRSASTASSAASKHKAEKVNRRDSKEVSAAQSDPPGPVLSAADEWRFLGDDAARQEAIAKWQREQAGLNKGMEKVELWRVFALSQCAYVTKVFLGKSVSDATRQALQQLPDFIPARIAIGNDVVDVDPAAIRRLVEVGHDESLCEVREVTSLISPVRYYSAPWHPAFCVVARKLIKKGTFVFTYSGEMEQEIRNRDSVYVYDVQADNIRAHWPDCPASLPDMVIDAEKYGGVARFVNDSRYRLHEGLAEGEAENLNHTFVFVDKCVHLCFYVTRDVKAREELVSTYGDEFWSVCTGQMLIQHRKYYNHIAHYHQQLSSLLQRHHQPVPSLPSYLLEAEPLFSRKVARYPDEPHPTDSVATEEEWEVEYILSKGRMSRETHYLVKWLGFDHSYNSWVKKSEMASPQLILAFEQQLKHEINGAGGSRGNNKRKRKGTKKEQGKTEEEGRGKEEKGQEEAGQDAMEEAGVETPSSGMSGSDSDKDGQKDAKRKRKKKRKQANSGRAADGGSDTAEQASTKAKASSSGRKSKKDRASKGGSKAAKPTAEQREANRQKIRAAVQAARDKQTEERTAAGSAAGGISTSITLDESTDTEGDVEVEVCGEAGLSSVVVGQAPLLPPIAPDDRMALEEP